MTYYDQSCDYLTSPVPQGWTAFDTDKVFDAVKMRTGCGGYLHTAEPQSLKASHLSHACSHNASHLGQGRHALDSWLLHPPRSACQDPRLSFLLHSFQGVPVVRHTARTLEKGRHIPCLVVLQHSQKRSLVRVLVLGLHRPGGNRLTTCVFKTPTSQYRVQEQTLSRWISCQSLF